MFCELRWWEISMSPGEIGTSNVSLSFKTTFSDPFWCMLLLVRNAVDLQRGFTRTKPNIELWPESLHYFLSYLNFSHRLCWATPFFLYWLSWKRVSRHVTPSLLRDWVIAWKVEKLWTGYLTQNSKIIIISLTFPEKNHP